jgi:tRNA(His) 5'-end guanylyltransferase
MTIFDHLSAHVNNLYNTAFWALIYQGGQSKKDAHESLRVRFRVLASSTALT